MYWRRKLSLRILNTADSLRRFCEQLKTAQLTVHGPKCHRSDQREERAIDSITDQPDIKRAQVTFISKAMTT